MNKTMHVITLAPIVRASARTLSYFSPVPYPKGAIVRIPIRKHAEQNAIVLNSQPASSLKTELRSADYTLRRLPKTDPQFATSLLFLQTLVSCAEHTVSGIGALVNALLPRVAFEALHTELPEISRGKEFEYTYIQELPHARREFFKNYIRSSFAKGRSVHILAPTVEKVEVLRDSLSRGIGKHTFIIHGKLSLKRQKSVWEEARDHDHPTLIISTPQFLALPRHDIGTIIVEDEGSDMYEAHGRPFIDFRYIAREYARNARITCIAADTLIRTETFAEATPMDESRSVYPSAATTRIIDMVKKRENTGFEIFSSEVRELLKEAEDKKTILYVTRRGTYPLTQCSDCGTIVKCEKCSYPLVLYEKKGKNVYQCHMCNRTYNTHIRCHNCQGWKLSLYGIGFDRVRQEIEELYPNTPLFLLDGNREEKKDIVDAFNASEGGILLTLASGVEYIEQPVPSVVVVSIDPLFALADFGISETIARLLFELRARATKQLWIQTRNADENVLSFAKRGDIEGFFENELADRKQFNLPPYTRLIQLRWSGRGASEVEKKVSSLLADYSPDIYFSFFRTKKGARIYNALLSLPTDEWPDPILAQKLTSLPRSVGINVDPVHII